MYCSSTDAGLEEQSQMSEGTNITNKTEIKKLRLVCLVRYFFRWLEARRGRESCKSITRSGAASIELFRCLKWTKSEHRGRPQAVGIAGSEIITRIWIRIKLSISTKDVFKKLKQVIKHWCFTFNSFIIGSHWGVCSVVDPDPYWIHIQGFVDLDPQMKI